MSVGKGLLAAFMGGAAGAGAGISKVSSDQKNAKLDAAKAEALALRQTALEKLKQTNSMAQIGKQGEIQTGISTANNIASGERNDKTIAGVNSRTNATISSNEKMKTAELKSLEQRAADLAKSRLAVQGSKNAAALLSSGGGKTNSANAKLGLDILEKFRSSAITGEDANALFKQIGIPQMEKTSTGYEPSEAWYGWFGLGKGKEIIEYGFGEGDRSKKLFDEINKKVNGDKTTTPPVDPTPTPILTPPADPAPVPKPEPSNPKLPADPATWDVKHRGQEKYVVVGDQKIYLTDEEYKIHQEASAAALREKLKARQDKDKLVTNPANRL